MMSGHDLIAARAGGSPGEVVAAYLSAGRR